MTAAPVVGADGASPREASPRSTSLEDTFLQHRPMLVALAYRLLGSVHDAEDAVQDAYLRWAAEPRDDVANPAAFLTTVTTRLALDRLRSAQARREIYVGPFLPEPLPTSPTPPASGPEESAALRETATLGMLLLMEKLSPAERAVFVLREAFDVPYPQIAETLERTEASCRQLYRRAKAHTADQRPKSRAATSLNAADPQRGRRLVESFLAAAQGGNLQGLMDLFHEDVVVITDGGGRVKAALRPIHGAAKASRLYTKVYTKKFSGAEFTVREFNNVPGMVVVRPRATFVYLFETDEDGRITNMYGISNPEKLKHLGA